MFCDPLIVTSLIFPGHTGFLPPKRKKVMSVLMIKCTRKDTSPDLGAVRACFLEDDTDI